MTRADALHLVAIPVWIASILRLFGLPVFACLWVFAIVTAVTVVYFNR